MNLKDILQKIVAAGSPILLNDKQSDWEAADLLTSLSEIRLNTKAFFQPGLYIAEITAAGYLGQVMYKIKVR